MRVWVLAVLIGSLPLSVLGAERFPYDEIHVASEVWAGHTEADGSGLAWDILRLVYESEGIRLVVQPVPYTRAVGLAQRGNVDAWVGAYLHEIRGVHFPHWHYDIDYICALSHKHTPVPSLATLGNYRLAWVRGYDYQDYLPNIRHFKEIQRRTGVLDMLTLGHVDFFVGERSEINSLLVKAANADQYRVTPLVDLPLYLGFTDSPRGHRLADIFDRRMAVLVQSGELRSLFQRWKEPYVFGAQETSDVAQ